MVCALGVFENGRTSVVFLHLEDYRTGCVVGVVMQLFVPLMLL